MESYVDDIQKAIIKDLNKSTKTVLFKAGVDRSSELTKSIDWEFRKDHFVLVANDYFEWVDKGRARGTKQIPAQDLIPWLKKNSIVPRFGMTYNTLAFIIAKSIKLHGIKPKKYGDKVVNASTDIISEEISMELSEIIVDELVDALEN